MSEQNLTAEEFIQIERIKVILAEELLQTIKDHSEVLRSLRDDMIRAEEDVVYRFYHGSYKVFTGKGLIQQAKGLFEKLSPRSLPLNNWYLDIVNAALSKQFDSDRTNKHWVAETEPILQAIWHCKYFLEQMVIAAEQLSAPPQLLPSGWAAVLHLFNIR